MFAVRSVLRHLLVIGDAVAIEHEHDDRALRGAVFIFAEALEAEQEARDADGDAGGRDLLAGEALDQPVIAPAADHRAEPDGLPALVFDRRCQLSLEHRAGVIFQTTHDRGVNSNSVGVARSRDQCFYFKEFLNALCPHGTCSNEAEEIDFWSCLHMLIAKGERHHRGLSAPAISPRPL